MHNALRGSRATGRVCAPTLQALHEAQVAGAASPCYSNGCAKRLKFGPSHCSPAHRASTVAITHRGYSPMQQAISRSLLALAMLAVAGCSTHAAHPDAAPQPAAHTHRVIVFVWDGMRPDAISESETPHLAALAQRGSYFSDNHSSYPTFTMMNAAGFATGAYSGESGFFGNTVYRPGAPARDAAGKDVQMDKPVFSEDYGVLRQLDENQDHHLLVVGTLFQAAQKAGLTTAAVGKSGPAFMQDYKNGGVILDEKAAFPLAFARELQAAGIALPATTPFAYPDGAMQLAADNGDPTRQGAIFKLADHVTPDPSDRHGAPPTESNKYLMSVFLDYILPHKQPDLAVVWLRNPDSAEHPYGPGAPNFHAALRAQDALLGQLQARLVELGLDRSTDLIVVSDHGHSSVSGPLELFPLRRIDDGKVGAIDAEHGYSVSGQVRLADALSRAGIAAYDGGSCMYDPVMSGILADGSHLHPDQAASASVCPGYKYPRYTTPDHDLPHPFLPRESFVVSSNGGTDYLFQPAHDAERVRTAVRFLQSHEEFGAIFVDDRYGDIPGTLPLSLVRLENAEGRNPDIVVGYSFDEHALVQGMPGIEFQGVSNHISRGMHGSFSPVDVHNMLIASGPDFRAAFRDPLPSGNVDVAPTIARILGLQLPQADGRALLEALQGPAGVDVSAYHVAAQAVAPKQAATGLSIKSAVGADTGKTRYSFDVRIKQLSRDGETYPYFDSARAVRQ
jgi:arylsulfatase A-like enzyme